MLYFSEKDTDKINPFQFAPHTVKLPLFIKFYAWWNNLSISKLSELTFWTARARSTEALSRLMTCAKKEVDLLVSSSYFFPNWRIFAALNAWINGILTNQLKPVDRIITTTISETLNRNVSKLANLKEIDAQYTTINTCLKKHQQEIAAQPPLQKTGTYASARGTIKKTEDSIIHLHRHREHVIATETPRGKPFFYHHFGGSFHIVYTPSRRDSDYKPLRAHLHRINEDIRYEINQVTTLKKGFFLPKCYNDPEKYKELLQERTDNAIAGNNFS